jgi:hypothetical protein
MDKVLLSRSLALSPSLHRGEFLRFLPFSHPDSTNEDAHATAHCLGLHMTGFLSCRNLGEKRRQIPPRSSALYHSGTRKKKIRSPGQGEPKQHVVKPETTFLL